MRIVIEGVNLPGRSCATRPGGGTYENIQVGPGNDHDHVGLVPGDAPSAHWIVDVRLVRGDGGLDFRGPSVRGPRGDRFVYLNWGAIGADGSFELFRRAKLILSEIDPALVEQVDQPHHALVCTVNLTDRKGHPICARLKPPAVTWTVRAEARAD